ncbi:pyrimidine reductase riboflavin biosynthesis [Roseburia sp. CAG:50]|nr:pyrimidine reductase riboflavin biosynthesis [Roseburia sp. CAG:50]
MEEENPWKLGGSDFFMQKKEEYMRRALELARKGEGHTSPNPMVGCVVVKDGRIISEGYHEKYGEFHAERNALTRCTEDTAGADLYVTLEPCCHQGKTPPCTDIIIEKKIARVFVGSMDSNPLVAGKGVQILRDHGIYVETGILDAECRKLNEVFYHYIATKTPFVVMKYAMTLDGKIACATGDSKWVTGEIARTQVHRMRGRYRGIMVGIGTVLADDPMLNCRVEGGVDPVRIICDSNLHIPTESQIVKTASDIETIVACSQEALESERKQEKIRRLREAGIQIIGTEGAHGVNLVELMKKLGEQNIDSILLEGGGTLNASALEDGIVNKVYAYIAGKLIGGMDARSPVEGMGIDRMADAITLQNMEIEKLGDDFCIVGYVK